MFILYIGMYILMIYYIYHTQFGLTALHYAVYNDRLHCAQLLLQAGAVIDIQTNVRTLDVLTVNRHVNTHDISY